MLGISRLVRSASLYGYPELAVSLGLNPEAMLRRVGLAPHALDEADTPIPVDRVRQLLEVSAEASGTEDFGLRLSASRRLSNLGPISIVLREEPTGLAALETLGRYLRLINASLRTQIDYFPEVIVIREDIVVDGAAPMRQSVELAVGVMHRILKEILGASWTPRRVCFAHRPPRNTGTYTAALG
ncbi:MAG: AraC family transcriptional regulator, partial [Rhodoferax sp.]